MRDYLRTFSLCFEFWKNYRATEPFPGIGFQTTNERRPPDDLPCSEVKQSNPISAHYRPDSAKYKRSFRRTDLLLRLLGRLNSIRRNDSKSRLSARAHNRCVRTKCGQ